MKAIIGSTPIPPPTPGALHTSLIMLWVQFPEARTIFRSSFTLQAASLDLHMALMTTYTFMLNTLTLNFFQPEQRKHTLTQ